MLVKRIAFLVAILLLAVTAVVGQAQQPALLFVVTGQSNAGQRGKATQVAASISSAVPGAWYHAPQHTKTQYVVQMKPYSGLFGAELPFAHAIRDACPGRTILVVKRYSGGTSIIAWSPTAPNTQWKMDMSKVGNSGKAPQYPLVTKAVEQAIAKYNGPVEVAGVLWLQVERDSKYDYGAARYEQNLSTLIGALRAEYDEPDLPFVAMDSHTQLGSGGAVVHDAIVSVARDVPNVSWVATRDLPTSDGIHFDSHGLVTLGTRLADEWLSLNGGCD